jgi:hypothetical protein
VKEKLVNVGLLVVSVIFSLFALEIGLRAFIALRAYKEGSSYQYTYQLTNFRNHWISSTNSNSLSPFDPELGWVPVKQAWKGDRGIVETILENGIRSNGSGEFSDSTESILAVGDSFTFGDQVSDSETWPAQLERLSGRKVINAGVSGYGLDQSFLRARRFLSRDRFSTVIFGFIPDDIRRCQLSEAWGWLKPYFDFKDGRLMLENVPLPLTSPPRKESKLTIALEHTQLMHSVMKRFFPVWWHGTGDTQVHDPQEGREVACALLHELEGLTKSYGSELIVLAEHLLGETPSETIAGERVLNCLSDPATRVLDLRAALSELKAKDPTRYNRLWQPHGGHMSAEGNEFAARELLPLLTER